MDRYIYVAGPYTIGDVESNVRRAIDVGDLLLRWGMIPVIPHLCHFWNLQHPHNYSEWVQYTTALLERCDAVLRVDGESKGSDTEVAVAERLGMRVFYSLQSLAHHLWPDGEKPFNGIDSERS